MSFPISPSNGQIAIVNNIQYQYNSANSLWYRLVTPTYFPSNFNITNTTASNSNSTGALVITGGLGVGGNVYANAIYTNGLYYAANGNTFMSGAVTSGYLNNAVVFANSTGYLSNTNNFSFISSNNTLLVSNISVPTIYTTTGGIVFPDGTTQATSASSSAIDGLARTTANAAYNQANAANILAQSAYNFANTRYSASGGTVSGSVSITNDLSISGNLTVLGTTTSVNASTVVATSPVIFLANNNLNTDNVDIGFVGHYGNTTNSLYTGLIRDYGKKEYIFFQSYSPTINTSNAIINIADPSFAYANVYASYFKGNLIATSPVSISSGGTNSSGGYTTGALLQYNGTSFASLSNVTSYSATGNSTAIPIITTDSYGRVTNLTTASISSTITLSAGSGSGSVSTGGTLTIGAGGGISTSVTGSIFTITNTGVTSLSGTANQVSVSTSTGSVSLSLPQNIGVGDTPSFVGTNFSGYASSLNIGGSAGSATNAGYATSAGSATNATYATSSGTSGSATNATYSTSSTYAASSGKITTPDLRSTNITPNYFGQGVSSAFLANSTDGLNDGGSYHGIIQFQQWSDATGGGSAQIGITDNNNLWHRGSSGALTGWSSWAKILDSANYNSYSPSLTGTGASGTWGINISGSAGSATNATTASTANSLNTSNNYQVNSLGVGTSSTTTGQIKATTAIITPGTNGVTTGLNVVNGDITTYRSGGTTGVIYLSNSGGNYLYWNGSNYYFGGNIALDSSNYTSYSPTLTGSGASGTWGINVTGSAGSATNVTGIVGVPNGGTGLTSLTAGYIPYGNGTSALSTSSNLTFDGTSLSVNQFVQAFSFYTRANSNGYIALNYNANAASRSWRMQNDVSAWGDFAIQQSTTQIGGTYTTPLYISSSGNVGIGTTPAYKLEVNGSFAATTKSFVINHPTKKGMKLRYGSLEGPENGVYIRGKLTDSNTIVLPEYWTKLIDEDSITVQLTPIGKHQKLFVEDIVNNTVIVGNENLLNKNINCFYVVFAERIDVEKLEVEI